MIDAADYGAPALGYVMRYRDLAAALDARIPAKQWLVPAQVASIAANDGGALITVTRGDVTQQITAKLVVHAEGTPQSDPEVSVSDYHQHAVIAEVRPATPHGNRAWERFTPDGPLALLPLGQDYSVVFTVPPEKAEHLLALDDAGFLAALRVQFGTRLDFVHAGPRAAYPLALRVRRQIVQSRQVWIGNAAQTLHPVSGQGFNLGLRDAWELAERLLDGLEQQSDAGHPAPRSPPTPAAASSTAWAARCSPTASSASSPTTCRRCAPCAASACSPSTPSRRCATSSPSACSGAPAPERKAGRALQPAWRAHPAVVPGRPGTTVR